MPRKYGTTVYVSQRPWRPMMLRLKGTVLPQIWLQILLVGVYSTIVFLIHQYSSWKMNYSLSLVSVMGMVVSLLLVFRTNTAYDRYWEGRRLWSQMTLCIRNLTRAIWVCVAESDARDVLEKKSAVNLLVAFAYSTKHYLREEYGYNYDDMIHLLAHIPKYSLPTSTQPMDWRMDIPMAPLDSLTPAQSAQGQASSSSSAEEAGRPSMAEPGRIRRHSKSNALAFDFLTPTNIPMELSYYIGSYIKACSNKGKVDPATLTVMNNALVAMIDCLTSFERILRTPIPLAYSIHLHHATWIYLLALPFQLVSNMSAFVIPATMLAAFTLLGILGIGYEIENPFNDDYNDLPLDDFCRVIQAEVDSMVATRAPVPSDWVFDDRNYPLNNCSLTAKELAKLSLEEVHALMANEDKAFPLGRRPTHIKYSRSVNGNAANTSFGLGNNEKEEIMEDRPENRNSGTTGSGLTRFDSHSSSHDKTKHH
ncbi:hypothetical protein BGW38_003178 [Lunasporangiospora selenospora]|uniref:Uncharacterized protein n=1 Tax=Lunasporangiospora selenospora TaxID=979761 RepID=A0A9P6G1F3_9FUNG|nr:hypothetical protein BGW38_003178 [Lunasporangiospora selenospora]